jgi:hypothetical protein
MSFRTAALTAWCVLCGSRSAYAAPHEARPLALDVEGQVGWVEGDQSGGVDLGATTRIRYSVLTAGISLQGATSIFGGLGVVSGTFRDQGEDWLNGGSYDRLGTSTVRVGQTRISILATIAVTI